MYRWVVMMGKNGHWNGSNEEHGAPETVNQMLESQIRDPKN